MLKTLEKKRKSSQLEKINGDLCEGILLGLGKYFVGFWEPGKKEIFCEGERNVDKKERVVPAFQRSETFIREKCF